MVLLYHNSLMNAFENRPWLLLSRKNCHLCYQMAQKIRQFLGDEKLLQVIDIDAPQHSAFLEKYDILVPVLFFKGKEVCHYHFDEAAAKSAEKM